uniref:Uncharacterized protein n=1 Tax=Felis catus TaxID=9685 RepID=A0ABI7Y4G3_FELCA
MNAARDSHEQKDEAFSLPDDNLGSSNWEAADLGEDKRQETSVGEDVEKKKHLRTVGGSANWYSHCGKQYGGSSKN